MRKKSIEVKKETTAQSYGEFYNAFFHLKGLVDRSQKGWSQVKMAALTMAAFTIEAHANHVGQQLFPSWKSIEHGISPIGKMKMFIEMKKIDIVFEKSPFNTVHELMKWRNQVAHGITENWSSTEKASVETSDQILGKIEHSSWMKFVLNADLERIDKDCVALMETIHKNGDYSQKGTWKFGLVFDEIMAVRLGWS